MNGRGAVRRIGLLAAGCSLALVCGLVSTPALAFFTSGGTGADTAATGTLPALIVLPATTGSFEAPLYPGATGDLIVRLKNPNTKPVTLLRVSQGGAVSVDGGGAGCTSDPEWPNTLGTSGVGILEATSLDIVLDGGSTRVLHLPGAASMSLTSDTDCQGATFNIPISVEVSQ